MSAKLQRTFVSKDAYYILRDWIIEGRLEPGQKLRDKDLAEQLGVSRTPIREALLRLEDEEFIQTKPNSATIVSPIDLHNSYHLYSIVWSLEKLALEQSIKTITDEQIEKMSQANEKMLKALKKKERLKAVESDKEFHAVFINASENAPLIQLLSGLKSKLKRLELYYFESVIDAHHSYKEHQEIIEAFKKRKLPAALKAVENNWKASFSRIQGTNNSES